MGAITDAATWRVAAIAHRVAIARGSTWADFEQKLAKPVFEEQTPNRGPMYWTPRRLLDSTFAKSGALRYTSPVGSWSGESAVWSRGSAILGAMARGSWLLAGFVGLGCGGIVERVGERGESPPDSQGGAGGTLPTGHAGSGSKGPLAGGSSAGGSSAGGGSPTDPATGEGSACFNDIDCPNPNCGGLVCNWTKIAPRPEGMKVFYCSPAGTAPRGSDGWCTTDADCKCHGLGAHCIAPYCTFTRASDAP